MMLARAVALSLMIATACAYHSPSHARSLLQKTGLPTFSGRFSFGVEHSCVLDKFNKGYCMGNNFDGQLGLGDLKKRNVPTEILGNISWRFIQAGDWHSCGLAVDDLAYCWGYNGDGRCGTGAGKDPIITKPTLVAGNAKWKWISAGFFYSCGVQTSGKMFCWGKNNYGRLGNGSPNKNESVPKQVGKASNWEKVYAGGDLTCALNSERNVFCWGNNEFGQLGVGKTKKQLPYSAVPVKIPGTFKLLGVSGKYGCGIKPYGGLFCWGSNDQAQMGNGRVDKIGQNRPRQIPGTWRAISCGQFVVAAINSNNIGYVWGAGYTVPLPRFTNAQYIAITAGDWNAGAVRSDGSGFALWENEHGEGGVGSIVFLKTPTLMKGGKKWGLPTWLKNSARMLDA